MAPLAMTAFLSGVLLATSGVPSHALLWLLLGIAAFAGIFVRTPRSAFAVLVLLVSLSAGFWRFGWAGRPSALQAGIGSPVILQGYVDGDFERTESGGRFYARIVRAGTVRVHERILVLTSAWPSHGRGAFVELEGGLEEPANHGDFDYVSYLKKEGARTLIRYPDIRERGALELGTGERVRHGLLVNLGKVRDAMAGGVRAAVTEPSAAYLNGIILGMRSDIPADLSDAFSRTGTTHVLAISGYNVAIVAQGIMLALLYVVERRKAVWLAVAGIGTFALLTGASASVIRAAIMGSLVLVTRAFGGRFRPLPLILAAAVLMVAANPFLLRYDIGFQLSFAAVAGLVYLTPLMERVFPVRGPFLNLAKTVHATAAAQIATLPLILHYFGTLPVYSLPTNIVILPLIPYAMALGTVAGIGSLVAPAAGAVLGFPALAVSQVQLAVVRGFSALPGASLSAPLPWTVVLIGYAVMALIAARFGLTRTQHPERVP